MMTAVVLAAASNRRVQLRELQLLVDHRGHEERVHRGDHRRLGRREHAELQPTTTMIGMHQREGRILQGSQHLGAAGTGRGLDLLLAHQPPPGDPQRDAQHQAGDTPAMNSLEIDTLAATPNTTKPIEGGMMGAMMERRTAARRSGPVVAGAVHHGQQQRGQRRRIGHRRAGQRRHDDGRHDAHVTQAAAHVADQGHGELHDAARQAAGVHDLAGQHEEGHGQQREAVGAFDGVLREDLRVEHVHVPHQRGAAGEQREGDRHAERHGAEQRPQEDGDGHVATFRPPPGAERGWLLPRIP
jgi:hypothetical protein